MSARALMVQGTASHAGKSVLVAALCRIYARRGFRVAPFKAQNMSLNAYVTPDGREIGRAQAVQARAAGLEPRVEMNPILLKPEAEDRSQVVLLGRPWKTLAAREYYTRRPRLWWAVRASLSRLRSEFELVFIEGAGSPAEINLRHADMVNMSVALEARAPVLLVGDIDRGGVFASLFGTLALLPPQERDLVGGLVINRFRGDPRLLEEGLLGFELLCGSPVLGVIPHAGPLLLPEEDSLGPLEPARRGPPQVDLAVIRLPHLANHDDFDALRLEEGVSLRWVSRTAELGQPDAVILPGSKATVADLDFLVATGLAAAIRRHAAAGRAVVGICGGYQMMGQLIRDPRGVESPRPQTPGLGLLPVLTVFRRRKRTRRVRARPATRKGFFGRLGAGLIEGYEIHLGQTRGGDPALMVEDGSGWLPDGAVGSDGAVWGTYLHGIFDNTAFRRAWLGSLGWPGSSAELEMPRLREAALESWADLVAGHLDLQAVDRLLELGA